MRILVLGGDGYLGWPTAMYLTERGHTVTVVDNYLRRTLARQFGIEPLFETSNLERRTELWRNSTGHAISVFIGDLCHWEFVAEVFQSTKPDAIIHYAEQPSAPFSMVNRQTASLTLTNNLMTTANTIFAVREFCPAAHIVKLGTMGEYGTPNIDIEEGWLDVTHKGRSQRFLYPRQGGSLYHTTKIMDTDLLWFYVRAWNLAVTDLMQGPVYGFSTNETTHDELFPHFYYDEIFGTVINRFLVQAVSGHPLTVYGKGNQTRGFLNILDTMQCIRLALETPAKTGELRILNQFVEVFSVNQLADKVVTVARSMGLTSEIENIPNPRIEAEEHYYKPARTGFSELGLVSHQLTDDVIAGMLELVLRFRSRIKTEQFVRGVRWRGA
jgi:UDP-sulfoquinovose synthase